MTAIPSNLTRACATAAFALVLAAPVAARAGEPAATTATAPVRISGTVSDFHGKYGLVVRDDRGALIDVRLRQGTVIQPVGLRLERGMRVVVAGTVQNRTLAAARIDAPFERGPVAALTRDRQPAPDRDWPPERGAVPQRNDWGSPNPGGLGNWQPEGTSTIPAGPRGPQ
jgi:hypothetical protein